MAKKFVQFGGLMFKPVFFNLRGLNVKIFVLFILKPVPAIPSFDNNVDNPTARE